MPKVKDDMPTAMLRATWRRSVGHGHEEVRIEVHDLDDFIKAAPHDAIEVYVADDSAYGEHAIEVEKRELSGFKVDAID